MFNCKWPYATLGGLFTDVFILFGLSVWVLLGVLLFAKWLGI